MITIKQNNILIIIAIMLTIIIQSENLRGINHDNNNHPNIANNHNDIDANSRFNNHRTDHILITDIIIVMMLIILVIISRAETC